MGFGADFSAIQLPWSTRIAGQKGRFKACRATSTGFVCSFIFYSLSSLTVLYDGLRTRRADACYTPRNLSDGPLASAWGARFVLRARIVLTEEPKRQCTFPISDKCTRGGATVLAAGGRQAYYIS